MEVREPALAYRNRKYSIEEYLQMEEVATEKHEYYRGEIFAMSGAKLNHNHITRNLMTAFAGQLRGKGCQPFGSDLRVHIEKNTLFTYPDLSIVCGKPQTLHDDQFNLLNPTILVEVLSQSNRSYDRGEKFKLYRDIDTLKEYVIVDSLSYEVECWRLNHEHHWELEVYNDLTQVVNFPAIKASIPMHEIYEQVELC